MGPRTTYYSDAEEQALEEIANRRDESFSALVRTAIREVYGVGDRG